MRSWASARERMRPRLCLLAALCGASWSYEVGAAFLHLLRGVKLSARTVENTICAEQWRPAPLEPDPLDELPGVVAVDGVLLHGREKKQWLEMKVASFFSSLGPVSKDRREVRDASFAAGAMEHWADFEEVVTREAERRGLDCTQEVEFVADGAEGIWQLQELVFPHARKRLDEYHLKCKVSERSRQAYRGNTLKQQHREQLESRLREGRVVEAIKDVRRHLPRDEEKRRAAEKLLQYLVRHEERIPDYAQVRAAGGSVSSGLVEKGNDLVVVRRMKRGEMHWSREGAQPVIEQRTAFINQYARRRTGPYDLAFCSAMLQ